MMHGWYQDTDRKWLYHAYINGKYVCTCNGGGVPGKECLGGVYYKIPEFPSLEKLKEAQKNKDFSSLDYFWQFVDSEGKSHSLQILFFNNNLPNVLFIPFKEEPEEEEPKYYLVLELD